LTQDDRAIVRARVVERIDEIRVSLQRDTGSTSAVTPDSAIGRLTRQDAMQAGHMTEAMRRQRQAELSRLEVALRRIDQDDDEYGECGQCESPIAMARLMARPDARLCVACAELAERK